MAFARQNAAPLRQPFLCQEVSCAGRWVNLGGPPPCVPLPLPGTGRKRDVLKVLGSYVSGFYAKFWILVCAGMFIVVSFAGRLVVYKIVYMFLFLLSLSLFQVSALWRTKARGEGAREKQPEKQEQERVWRTQEGWSQMPGKWQHFKKF